MPNGRPRQRNTRHANSQRNLQSVRAEAVVDEAPPVVQAEAVADLLYTADEVSPLLEELEELKDKYEKVKSKYNQAKSGNLLSFQEVELEDKDKEINDLTYMLEKTMEKLKEAREENKKILNDGQKAFFLYHIVTRGSEDGAHIHLGDGKVVKVLSKEEADEVRREVENDPGRRLTREEIMEAIGIQ